MFFPPDLRCNRVRRPVRPLLKVPNDSPWARGHDSVGCKRDVDFRSSHAVLAFALKRTHVTFTTSFELILVLQLINLIDSEQYDRVAAGIKSEEIRFRAVAIFANALPTAVQG